MHTAEQGRGRAPKGKRLIGKTPHGHWKLTTFITALRREQITAPMVIDRSMNGEIFLAYVLTFLLPTLSKGDIVVMDNLAVHKVAGVAEAIEVLGARLLYLLPYSLDLRPIEQVFAKLKALLRKAKERIIEDLRDRIGKLWTPILHSRMRKLLRQLRICFNMIGNRSLAKLARGIDWSFLEQRLGAGYTDRPGRPPLPTRLMAGLAILKHMHNLSDETLCER